MKKQHPADATSEAEQIAAIRSASHFMASLFVGRGQYLKAEARTCLAAMRAGADLRAQHPAGPDCLLYAVQADGRAVCIDRPRWRS